MRRSHFTVLPLSFCLCLLGPWAPAQYVDISNAAGIVYPGRHAGVAFGDFDADGWDDLYFSRRDGENRLYRNLGNGTFQDVTKAAGVNNSQETRLAVWGDLNNDGYPELYVGNIDVPDILYLNNGDGTFTDISWEAGIYNAANPFSVSMADINNDGWLDIYVANFKSENKCYLNNGAASRQRGTAGKPTFTDYTYRSGALSTRNAMASLFFDGDNDGDLDLYLVHDGQPNMFYKNQGDGRFVEISEAAGVNHPGSGMGADAGDINNDGWLDLYVTNLYENVLYLNNGDGTFTDISKHAGVDDYGMGWGTNFLDFNNDGWLDLYIANDSYFSPYPNVLYQNNGNSTFTIAEANAPVSSRLGGYGSACSDIDLDGRVDIALSNTGANDFNQLFHNQYPTGQWIGFRLQGINSNRDAVGARVEIWDKLGIKRVDEIAAGSSFAAQNSLMLHFGLGPADGIDSLHIRWPGGKVQQVTELEANHYYRIVEGSAPEVITTPATPIREITPTLPAGLTSVFPNPASELATIHLRLDQPAFYRLTIVDAFGREVRVLASEYGPTGTFEHSWDGRNDHGQGLPTGLYFVELSIANQHLARPLVWRP